MENYNGKWYATPGAKMAAVVATLGLATANENYGKLRKLRRQQRRQLRQLRLAIAATNCAMEKQGSVVGVAQQTLYRAENAAEK